MRYCEATELEIVTSFKADKELELAIINFFDSITIVDIKLLSRGINRNFT